MFKNSVTLLILAFVIGFVAGCGGSNPLASDAQSNIEEQNFQAALDAAEQSIAEYPQDPLGYYFKAVALGNIAEEQPADQRESYYQRMNDAFEEAREVASQIEEADDVPDEMTRIDIVKDALWRSEHSTAVDYVTNDSLIQVTPNNTQVALDHLHNATVIRPDSMLTWDTIALIHNQDGNFAQAAEIKRKVIDSEYWDADSTDYRQLGSFHWQAEQPESAVSALEEGRELFPSSVRLRSFLADIYMETDRAQEAIDMVSDLVEENPDNAQYRLALGTQIYRAAFDYSDSLDANVEEIYSLESQVRNEEMDAETANQQMEQIMQENEELLAELEDRSQQAIEQLEMVVEQRPDDVQAYDALGIIYQNWAVTIFHQRNLTEDNERAAELGEQANEYFELAAENYRQVVERQPDNIQTWQALYDIYINLGMDEAAQEAAEKGGLNDGN